MGSSATLQDALPVPQSFHMQCSCEFGTSGYQKGRRGFTDCPSSLQVSIKSICVTLEAGVGHRTIPMLLAKSCFHGHVTNWFTLISIHSHLDMEVIFLFLIDPSMLMAFLGEHDFEPLALD